MPKKNNVFDSIKWFTKKELTINVIEITVPMIIFVLLLIFKDNV